MLGGSHRIGASFGLHLSLADGGDAMLDESLRHLARWLATTQLTGYMYGRWEWSIAESLHFIGLSLLIGSVGLFDLRLMGLGRQIPFSALHRLIPWGIGGYVLNVLTGL